MLEEEVTLVRKYNKLVEKGEVDENDYPSVFLFNLHKDKDLQKIYGYKMNKRAKEAGELIEEIASLEDED